VVIERRAAVRYELTLPIKLVGRGYQSLSMEGETKNLSWTGVLFRTQADLRIGERIEYYISLPSRANDRHTVLLHCFGKVVRRAGDEEVAATLDRYEFLR
jgi:hypothetical protein